MVDDFHGTEDWENFMNGMRQVLPDRPVENLQSADEIFHTLYDVDDKMQIPGEHYVWSGRTYEKDGYQPKWRAIRDDKGRIIVAICQTCTSAMRGSGPTTRNTRRRSRRWRSGWTRLYPVRYDALIQATSQAPEKKQS